MADTWTFAGQFGPTDLRDQNATTKLLVPPTVVTVYQAGTTNAAIIYTDRTGTTQANNPLSVGDPIGTVGIDISGNILFFAPPGSYDLLVDGTVYPNLQVVPDPDDLESLRGQAVVIPSTVNTVSADLVSVDQTTQILANDLRVQITAGAPGFRFTGMLKATSTSTAGFIMSIIGSTGAGADLSYTLWAPAAGLSFDRFGAAPASCDFTAAFGASATDVNIFFQGSGRGTVTQGMQFRFHQKTTTAGTPTTVRAWHSWSNVYTSTV